MQAHWQSEDGTTEIWLNEWSAGLHRLVIEVPEGLLGYARTDAYVYEVANSLRLVAYRLFGLSGDDKFVKLDWPMSQGFERYPADAVFVMTEWKMIERRIRYTFIGRLAEDFRLEAADWQNAMGQQMLEAPNAQMS